MTGPTESLGRLLPQRTLIQSLRRPVGRLTPARVRKRPLLFSHVDLADHPVFFMRDTSINVLAGDAESVFETGIGLHEARVKRLRSRWQQNITGLLHGIGVGGDVMQRLRGIFPYHCRADRYC